MEEKEKAMEETRVRAQSIEADLHDARRHLEARELALQLASHTEEELQTKVSMEFGCIHTCLVCTFNLMILSVNNPCRQRKH